MPGLDEQPNELARLVCGDSARHADEDPSHGAHCADERMGGNAGRRPEAGFARREAYRRREGQLRTPIRNSASYFGYLYSIMPSETSSKDMVK